MRQVPAPLGARGGCWFFLIPLVPLLVAIFVLKWPWWGDALAAIVPLAVAGVVGNRYEAWQLRRFARGRRDR